MRKSLVSAATVAATLAACQSSPSEPANASAPTVPSTSSVAVPSTSPSATESLERELTRAGYYGVERAKTTWDAERESCPGARNGSELVGTAAPAWGLSHWVNTDALTLASLRGRVVVVRFWTAPGCPFCVKTMPALEALSKELVGEPVTFVGAFHGKPEASAGDMAKPREVAEAWNITFPIALDDDWKTLRAWWLATGHRHATSATFVIGHDGRFIHVHPGPVFHPSDSPDEMKQNRDYLAVAKAIKTGIAAAKRR